MKYFYSSLTFILFISTIYFTPVSLEAYTIKTNQGAKLNYAIQNVINCQAWNNYYKWNWGGNGVWAPVATPGLTGNRNYPAGQFTNPGSYQFWIGCTDDDSPNFIYWWDSLIVEPTIVTPTSLNSSCNSPANTQATLSWSPVAGATSYRIMITKPPSGCPTGWSDVGSGCQFLHLRDSISFATESGFNYNWFVNARVGTIMGSESVMRSVSCTVPPPPPPPPPPPVLPPPPSITVDCNSRGNNVDISWPAVAGASAYRVRLDWASTADNPDHSASNNTSRAVSWSVVPGDSNTITVNTVNSGGVWGGPVTRTFTCAAPAVPLPPTTVTPECNTEGTAVTLRWPAMANATSYHVRLNNLSTTDRPDEWNNNFAGTEIIYPVTPGVSYEAWVHSVNWVGVLSSETYSSPIPFACNPPVLPPPTSISYICHGAGDSATLSWPAVARASSYRVRLDWASTADNPDRSASAHIPRSVTYPVIPGVANRFTVNTNNAIGVWGDVAVLDFTCTVPASACPAGTPKTWNAGGNTCSGTTPLTSSGVVGSVIDSISPETGTAQYLCTNGTWSTDPVAAATCNAPVAGYPDLVVQTHNLGTYSNLTQDTPITLAGRMRNNGTVSTPIAVFTNFSYRWGAIGGYTTIREFNKGVVGPTGIIPQDSVNFTPNQAGQLFLQYCVDSRNQINEGGYEDNCRQVGPITVSAPVVSGPGTPRGSIGAARCDIAVGDSECNTLVVWESENFVGTPEISQGSNVFSTEPVKNPGESRTVSQIDNTFTLRDTGSTFTVSTSALTPCLGDSIWVPGLGMCAEKPSLDVVADPNVIRSGNSANLNIVIDSAYDLSCTIKDGGRDVVFTHNGNTSPVTVNPPMTTRPLTSAQIVNIYCASPTYPELFGEGETRVSVVRTIEEI